MALIPLDWLLKYNGFTFDPEYTHTTGCEVTHVMDRAGRTTIYSEYNFSFRTWLVGFPTDLKVIDMLKRLNKPGGEFIYRGRSLGDFSINTVGGRLDVKYGPIPKATILEFNSRKQACLVQWSCVVHIPDCANAKYSMVGLELSYRVEHRQRPSGRVDRVTTGELTIANNRRSPTDRRIMDSPDEYRDKVTAPLAKGFRREWHPWVTDESRTRLSFGWTDIEMEENNFPPGIAWCDGSQKTASTERGVVQFTTSISMEYIVAAGYPPVTAEKAFAALVKERITAAQAEAGKGDPGQPAEAATVVLMSFSAEENSLYIEPKCAFHISFLVSGSTIKDIVKQSGMWKPASDKWDTWEQSVRSSSLNPYGYSNIRFKAEDDYITDACDWDGETASNGDRVPSSLKSLVPEYPNAATSWVHYLNNIHVEADTGLVTFKELAKDQPTAGTLVGTLTGTVGQLPINTNNAADGLLIDLLSGKYGSPPGTGFFTPGANVPGRPGGVLSATMTGKSNDFQNLAPSSTEETSQLRATASTCYVIMYGEAIRVGYPVPPPKLQTIEGIEPQLDNRLDRGEGFFSGIISNAGVPVFGAKWRLRYFLPKTPKNPITPPENPTL